jgi:hypothetical protein
MPKARGCEPLALYTIPPRRKAMLRAGLGHRYRRAQKYKFISRSINAESADPR